MFDPPHLKVCGDCDWPAPCFTGSGHYAGMYCSKLSPLQFKCTPTTRCWEE